MKQIKINNSIDTYIPDEGLWQAVEIALQVGRPLLITGEPGTGKTTLAQYASSRFSNYFEDIPDYKFQVPFSPKLLEFHTKSTSEAKDLFYTYDAISHFQQAQTKQANEVLKTAKDFIQLQALGKAIANAQAPGKLPEIFKDLLGKEKPYEAQSSVVLIDEIDKAPRDFPNDLLNELDELKFSIKELHNTGLSIAKENPAQILVILTSNDEKNLPDPFLRRCVFYHIPFPSPKQLEKILYKKFDAGNDDLIKNAVKFFEKARLPRRHKPSSTSELVDWLIALKHQNISADELTEQISKDTFERLKPTLGVLMKNQNDLEDFIEELNPA